MTQLKMAIWPDAPPAKGFDKLRLWTAGGHRGCSAKATVVLTVAHPNRASEIIPLISGNCMR
jgi:hypothetical protein